MDNSTVDVNH